MKRFVTVFLAGLLWSSPCLLSAAEASLPLSNSVDWKLFFNQIFALELRKEIPDEAEYQAALKKFTAYSPMNFNQIIDDVLKADSASDAYDRRLKIYDNGDNYKNISKLDFSKSIAKSTRELAPVKAYLETIQKLSKRSIKSGENFFDSAEAQNFIEAISTSKNGKQEVALVMIPGYAAHTIKFEIFPEIMEDMNRHWGRPPSRPILSEGNGFDITYENYKDFYGRSVERQKGFDIVHPAGWEMGNTIGFNAETADLMSDWIKNLPPNYAQKKLILLGYSKGAGIVMEMLQRHPELRSRVLGVVSYAGVIQGTHIARFGRKEIEAVLGNRSIEEFIKKVRARGAGQTIQDLAPFLASMDFSFLQLPEIKRILEIYGIETKDLESQADRILGGREVKEFVDGIVDLSPDTRTAWNIRFLDNGLMDPGSFFFNLTAVADVSNWATRLASDNVRRRNFNLLTPAFKADDKIDWPNFSLDAWFLYISSLKGFRLAPGGLYDAQVDLEHTKTPWIDRNALTTSLTAEEIQKLWETEDIQAKLVANGIKSLEQLKTTPRAQLLRPEAIDHIRAYDLGEIKGHHWSLFHQAFRAPPAISNEYAVWDFPRKAFMRAMLQTLALYNLVGQGEK
ncbi:MAG: hypothetical protein EOP07_12710 [Proteobacteria bacterium]|nr:MAG: hypothetical protein EOP07_12710 [Pseudomonadota bacterium]